MRRTSSGIWRRISSASFSSSRASLHRLFTPRALRGDPPRVRAPGSRAGVPARAVRVVRASLELTPAPRLQLEEIELSLTQICFDRAHLSPGTVASILGRTRPLDSLLDVVGERARLTEVLASRAHLPLTAPRGAGQEGKTPPAFCPQVCRPQKGRARGRRASLRVFFARRKPLEAALLRAGSRTGFVAGGQKQHVGFEVPDRGCNTWTVNFSSPSGEDLESAPFTAPRARLPDAFSCAETSISGSRHRAGAEEHGARGTRVPATRATRPAPSAVVRPSASGA